MPNEMTRLFRRIVSSKSAIILLMLLSFAGDFVFIKFFVQTQMVDDEQNQGFVGEINRKIYHLPNCPIVPYITRINRVEFSDFREAENQGYIACEICRPP